MIIEFVVDQIVQVKGHKPYIIARHLMPEQAFSVSKKSYLSGIEIESFLTWPRALDESRRPRFDLYVFYPARSNDINRFHKYTIVTLTIEEGTSKEDF